MNIAIPTMFSTVAQTLGARTRNAAGTALSPLERLVMHWLFKRIMGDGGMPARLTQVMTELAHVTRESFPEDNDATIDALMRESLDTGLAKTAWQF